MEVVPVKKLIVVWRITETCDLACPFCAYSRDLGGGRHSADPEQVLRFGRVLGEYSAQYNRPVLVSWLGGEPLLWKPIFDLSHLFAHELGLQVSLTTNGTRLGSDSVRERLLADFSELTVSVDGIGPGHDERRRTAGLYAQLENNVRRLAEARARTGRGPRLRVNTILMRDNIHEFESLCGELAGWGIEEVTFNGLGGRDRPEYYPDHCLRPEDVRWLCESLPGIRQRLGARGLLVRGDDAYLQRLSQASNRIATPVDDCGPGEAFLFVDEAGTIAPCHFTTQGYGLPLSELCTPADIADLPRRFALRRAAHRLGPCYDCPSTQVWGKFAPIQTPQSEI